MREQSTGAQGTVNLGEGEETALAETPFTDAKIWKIGCWWLSGSVFTKPQNCGQKQILPYTAQVLLPHSSGCGLMVSAGEEHPFKVLQLPAPSANVFLVLAQHITPLTVLIQTC